MTAILISAAVVFLLILGAFLGFARGETFPGLPPKWLDAILQITAEPRWTLRRWMMVVTAGVAPAVLAWSLGLTEPLCVFGWPMPAHDVAVYVWLLTGFAWTMGHSPFIANSQWMLALSGVLVPLPVAIVFAIAGVWWLALACALLGAVKPGVYWLMGKLVPAGGSFPLWWTVMAEILNGVFELGAPAALIVVWSAL
jgi:hypothetical protein